VKKFIAAVLSVLFFLPASVFATDSVIEDQFRKSFPANPFESITPTEIEGIYEIYSGNQIYYYMPGKDILMYGSLISKTGVNITRDSYLKKTAAKMAELPLKDALKIGHGKTAVVEFIDPNCYYCRESYKFFSKRNDVTVYVFFFPLSRESSDKIKHILCSKDAAKAYADVMSGKLDNNAQLNICKDAKLDEKIKAHIQHASRVGLRGTPLFYIKGTVVDGFEIPTIEKLLKEE